MNKNFFYICYVTFITFNINLKMSILFLIEGLPDDSDIKRFEEVYTRTSENFKEISESALLAALLNNEEQVGIIFINYYFYYILELYMIQLLLKIVIFNIIIINSAIPPVP